MERNTDINKLFDVDIGNNAEYRDMFSVVKGMLIISHGQSSVERGFSGHKELLKGNINEHILITCMHAFQRYQANAQDTKKDDEKSKKQKEMNSLDASLMKQEKSAMLRKLDEKLVIKAGELDKTVEQAWATPKV